MNASYNLIPQFIDEQFAAATPSGSLDAVTLFMDMTGFTAMTQAFMQRGRDGAETLSTILNHVFAPVVQAVYEQGGFITGFAGDAFTALFPIDEPLRACAAALNIHTLIQQEQHQATPFGEFTIAVRMGLAAGPVAWGIVGTERQRTYFFRGRVGAHRRLRNRRPTDRFPFCLAGNLRLQRVCRAVDDLPPVGGAFPGR